MFQTIYRSLIGRPLRTEALSHEALPKWKALPIFSSDALSSVGYGPEQIALVLGATALYAKFDWIVAGIVVLLLVVATSYSQVIRVNPGGGGSYSIARTYLGETPSLIAGAALLADYVLTVAVSVSAGTGALTSAFPALLPYDIYIDLFVLFGILMIVNLKGVQEASTVFVWPTYAFVVGMISLVIAGAYQIFTGAAVAPTVVESSASITLNSFTLFILLHAFANGCSSMTGVEAIANGVNVFKEPKPKNAIITTFIMALLLGGMLIGISGLIIFYHLLPIEDTTLLSLLAETVFGRSGFYYFIQLTTMLILYLAANTSFNGLPPLLSIMAQDGYVPRYLKNRGDRLSFDNGIILLTIAAGILIYIFQGNVDHLISLYALGVFLSFTIAQVGLVVYRWRGRDKGWIRGLLLIGFGALATASVIGIIIITKFVHGAWIILVFIPVAVYLFKKVHAHYETIRVELLLTPQEYMESKAIPLGKSYVVIPLASPTQAVAKALRYAKILVDGNVADIHAVHIATDKSYGEKVHRLWAQLEPTIDLEVINSPYRQMTDPLVRYVRRLRKEIGANDVITIIIPEFEPRKLWHRLLHNQSGIYLRIRLTGLDNVVVTTVPLKLKE